MDVRIKIKAEEPSVYEIVEGPTPTIRFDTKEIFYSLDGVFILHNMFNGETKSLKIGEEDLLSIWEGWPKGPMTSLTKKKLVDLIEARGDNPKDHILLPPALPKKSLKRHVPAAADYINYSYMEVFNILAESVKDNKLLADLENMPARTAVSFLAELRTVRMTSAKWSRNLHRLKGINDCYSCHLTWESTAESTSTQTVIRIPSKPPLPCLVWCDYEDTNPIILPSRTASLDLLQTATLFAYDASNIVDLNAGTITFPVQPYVGLSYNIYLFENKRFPALSKNQFSRMIEYFKEYWKFSHDPKAITNSIRNNPKVNAGIPLEPKKRTVALPPKNDPPKGAVQNHQFINYSEYIKSPEWKERARKRMRMDRFQCSICGTAKNLSVHHITYERLGREDMDDLITLCKGCHAKVHENDLSKKGANHAE